MKRLPSKYHPISLTCALSAFVLIGTACGGGDDNNEADAPSPSGDADVVVIASDTKFDAKNYSAQAGQVSFEYVERGQLPHTLLIEDKSGFKLSVNGDKSDQGEILLKSGKYTLYCDIAGHRQAGMEATLTVE